MDSEHCTEFIVFLKLILDEFGLYEDPDHSPPPLPFDTGDVPTTGGIDMRHDHDSR